MRLHAPAALLPGGWANDVEIAVADDGHIASVSAGVVRGDARQLPGPVVPGMPNLHSHAFQRAIAGLTGMAGAGGDSFWSWRERVYAFVCRVGPDDLEAIAAQLQVEMLEGGYTSVAEFQYLHHDLDGRGYANPAEMSERVAAAAELSGIGLTLLPVFYAHGGFGGRPPTEGQKRFVNDVDGFLGIVDRLGAGARAGAFALGIAPHSLRAATGQEISTLVAAVRSRNAAAPVHIHLAEQPREVDDCLAWSGARPIEWLLGNADVDARWCLVHCTQANAAEVRALAGSAAVVGLCPTTEADLGDGIFPAQAYFAAGGSAGVGSDSHARVDAFEELRLLEYGQRLACGRRNVLALPGQSVGTSMWQWLVAGGRRALARDCGTIAAGALADLVVLDAEAVALAGVTAPFALDAATFGPARRLVREVYVGGRRVVEAGVHVRAREAASRYRAAMRRLAEGVVG